MVAGCDGERIMLKCADGEILVILKAVYGTIDRTCAGQREENSPQCYSTVTITNLADTCSGKQKCSPSISDDLVGNECDSTVNGLVIYYQCIQGMSYVLVAHYLLQCCNVFYKPWGPKGFCQFEVIIVSSFCFI